MVDRGCDASVDLSDIMNWDIDKVATFYVKRFKWVKTVSVIWIYVFHVKHASVMHINVLHMTSVVPIFQN